MWRRNFCTAVVVLLILPVAAGAGAREEGIASPALRKAWELLQAGKPADAERVLADYQTKQRLDPGSAGQFYYIRGKIMETLQRSTQAADDFRRAYLYLPKGEMRELSLLLRGEIYLRIRYFYEAASALKIFIRMFPGSPYIGRAHIGLAEALVETGYLKESIEHYEKAAGDARAMFGKASVLQRLGMTGEAAEAYASALSKEPAALRGSDDNLCSYCENLRANRRFRDAEKCFESLKTPPFRGRAELGLGLIAMEESKYEAALQHLGSAANAADRRVRSQALLNLADVLMKAGKTADAKPRLEAIRREFPYSSEYDRAVLGLSNICRAEGDFDGSIRFLKELLFRRERLKEALDEFEAILRDMRNKNDIGMLTDLWRSVGKWLLDGSREKLLLEMMEALKDSDRDFLEIARYLTKYGSVSSRTRCSIALAVFYAERGVPSAAREYLEQVKRTGGSGADMLRLEARLYFAEKNFKASADRALAIKKIEKADLGLFRDLLSSGVGAQRVAARFEKAVSDIGGGPEDFTVLADHFYALGKKKEALRYYRLASGKEPSDEWVTYRLAALSPHDEATELLKKVATGNSPVSRSAGARLKEISIAEKAEEAY